MTETDLFLTCTSSETRSLYGLFREPLKVKNTYYN
ncbi:unnamed protein product [Larinioides sclopetarius]|uniref:Uncharacterized protein n=1 Tax=Larinioides sclopetarius TaxID=280406 RepID=A0AAV2BPI6_9ARAC